MFNRGKSPLREASGLFNFSHYIALQHEALFQAA
jgi:hypothetical protein